LRYYGSQIVWYGEFIMGKKPSKAFQDLQNLPSTKVKRKIQISRKKSNHLDDYAQELRKTYPDMKIIKAKQGDFKMSELLWFFLTPEKEFIHKDLKTGYILVSLAVVAWNLSLLPEEDREEEMEQFYIRNIVENYSCLDDFRGTIQMFIERKLEYFSDFDIFISDFKLEEIEDKFRLSVVSMVE